MPLYEKEVVKLFTKLKEVIVRWSFNKSIKELESQGAVLKDITIDIKEIDGEVYGELKMVNVVRYYSTMIPLPLWAIDQNRLVKIHTKGWNFYFKEDMDEVPETIPM